MYWNMDAQCGDDGVVGGLRLGADADAGLVEGKGKGKRKDGIMEELQMEEGCTIATYTGDLIGS